VKKSQLALTPMRTVGDKIGELALLSLRVGRLLEEGRDVL
jgi:hypothetical protein